MGMANTGLPTFLIEGNARFQLEAGENKDMHFSPCKFTAPWLLAPLSAPALGCPVAHSVTAQSAPQCPHQLLWWWGLFSQPWVISHACSEALRLSLGTVSGAGACCHELSLQRLMGGSRNHVAKGPRWSQGYLSSSLCLVLSKSLPPPVRGNCLIVAKRIKFKALSLSPLSLLPHSVLNQSPSCQPHQEPPGLHRALPLQGPLSCLC